MEGIVCGRYRTVDTLGAGGMAEVYLAKHELIDQEAAVKLLHLEMSSNTTVVRRFLQEAQAAAAIRHPGIVDIYDVGYTLDGRAYIVMERLRGETLSERLQRLRAMSVEATIPIIRQLAGAVGAAHDRGIIHRDLKPDNIFIIPDPDVPGGERIKVLDFGIAKLSTEQSRTAITGAFDIFGTPMYMAPEQCQSSASVDARSDLYSIGCILYRCLCGRPPFDSTEPLGILSAHLTEVPTPPRQIVAGLAPAMDALILRLLEKLPDKRVQSCAELIAALDRIQADMAASASGRLPVLAPVMDIGAPAAPPARPYRAASGAEEATLVDLHNAMAAMPLPAQVIAFGGLPVVDSGERRLAGTQQNARRTTRQQWLWLAAAMLLLSGSAIATGIAMRSSGDIGKLTGPAKPEPAKSVPAPVPTDAGLPDAGLPDAGLPDAGLPDASPPDAASPKPPPPPPSPPVSEQYEQIKADYLAGLYNAALKGCSRAMRIEPTYPGLASLCTLSACQAGNDTKAKAYIDYVPQDARGGVLRVCAKSNILLDSASP